jgi:phage terminase large subunit-like protein
VTNQASESAKIDPPMAGFNAIALMATNPASALTDSEVFLV